MQLKNVINILRYLPQTVYFNFHYLSLRQAMKLPILLYKPKLIKCKGGIRIEGPVKFGMVRMGFRYVSIYPNGGITWENHGGNVVFKGKARIGNDSYVSIGRKAEVVFGDNFVSNAGVKLVSYRGVKFGEGVSLGWGVWIMDTNLHPLYDLVKKEYKSASGPIEIGDYNWLASGCKVMHSVETPHRCIFGMNTIITRGCVMEPYCVMGGNPVKILTRNVMRNYDHDKEDL